MKKKSNKWFIKIRGSYLPNSREGWLTYIPFIAYLILVSVVATIYADSVPEAILLIVPNWVAAAVVMTIFAAQKS